MGTVYILLLVSGGNLLGLQNGLLGFYREIIVSHGVLGWLIIDLMRLCPVNVPLAMAFYQIYFQIQIGGVWLKKWQFFLLCIAILAGTSEKR